MSVSERLVLMFRAVALVLSNICLIAGCKAQSIEDLQSKKANTLPSEKPTSNPGKDPVSQVQTSTLQPLSMSAGDIVVKENWASLKLSATGTVTGTPLFKCVQDCPVGLVNDNNGNMRWPIDPKKSAQLTPVFGVSDSLNSSTLTINLSIHVDAPKEPLCTLDGQSDCLTTSSFPSAKISNVSVGDIKLGKSIAGVSGNFANCTSDGQTNCATGNLYHAKASRAPIDANLAALDVSTWMENDSNSLLSRQFLNSSYVVGLPLNVQGIAGIKTKSALNFTSSSAWAKVGNFVNPGTTGIMGIALESKDDAGSLAYTYRIDIYNGEMQCFGFSAASVYTNLNPAFFIPLDGTGAQTFWRIRHDPTGDNMICETSPDGISWTAHGFGRRNSAFNLSRVTPQFQVLRFANGPDLGNFELKEFHITPLE